MDVFTFSVVLVCLVLLLLWVLSPGRPRDFPPGPRPWPWLGNIMEQYQMMRYGQKAVMDALQKRYGKVIGLVLPGGVKMVVLREYDIIKEAFQDLALSGRPDLFNILYRGFGKKQGLIFSEGELWVEHRRFVLRHLRQLGFGKTSMEDAVQQEYLCLAERLRASESQELEAGELFTAAAINSIWQMIAAQRYALDDPRLHHLVQTISSMTTVIGPDVPVNMFPPLRHVLPRWSGFQTMVEHRHDVVTMFSAVVDEHRRTRDAGDARDYIDEFLAEQEKPDAENRWFTDENLSVIGMDLFTAGGDTASNTLVWLLLYLAQDQPAQRRLQAELDAVVGRERLPALSDQAQLPYTLAVLEETLRLSCLGPIAVPHCASFGDARIGAYTIPKGTYVISDLRAVQMDPAYWIDPEEFRPERFLTADGEFRRDERMVAFGVGRRICPGESMARMELFLLAASLYQQFHVQLGERGVGPEPKKEGTLRLPPPFTIRVKARNGN